MKKLLCMLLTVIMALTFCSSALAETIDLSSLTDEELRDTSLQIQDEMISRWLFDTYLYAGEHVVGEDIPAGRYVLAAYELYEPEDADDRYILCGIKDFDAEKGNWGLYTQSLDVYDIGQKVTFTLKPNQKLVIEYGSLEVVSFQAR